LELEIGQQQWTNIRIHPGLNYNQEALKKKYHRLWALGRPLPEAQQIKHHFHRSVFVKAQLKIKCLQVSKVEVVSFHTLSTKAVERSGNLFFTRSMALKHKTLLIKPKVLVVDFYNFKSQVEFLHQEVLHLFLQPTLRTKTSAYSRNLTKEIWLRQRKSLNCFICCLIRLHHISLNSSPNFKLHKINTQAPQIAVGLIPFATHQLLGATLELAALKCKIHQICLQTTSKLSTLCHMLRLQQQTLYLRPALMINLN
jgi:hypothetical protein